MTQKIKLRWVLAHTPYDLFLRSAKIFAQRVHEHSQGNIEIEILGLDQYEQKYNNGNPIDKYSVTGMVNDGIIDMSQMYTTQLGKINSDLRALDLPFLFENHEHAARVLDGEIGQTLLSDLTKNSNIRGLSFTYSGGYRMIVSNEPIHSVEDIVGKRVRVGLTPVAEDTFTVLGSETVAMGVHAVADAFRNDLVDIGENTWARYFRQGVSEYTKHVSNTKHSLFLTSVIINEKIWNSFSLDTQMMMREAALHAAREERVESLEDTRLAMEQCAEHGITVHEWSQEETDRMKSMTSGIHDKYDNVLGAGLIDRIKRA